MLLHNIQTFQFYGLQPTGGATGRQLRRVVVGPVKERVPSLAVFERALSGEQHSGGVGVTVLDPPGRQCVFLDSLLSYDVRTGLRTRGICSLTDRS